MKQAENFKGLTKYEDKMQFGTQPKPIVKYFYMNLESLAHLILRMDPF